MKCSHWQSEHHNQHQQRNLQIISILSCHTVAKSSLGDVLDIAGRISTPSPSPINEVRTARAMNRMGMIREGSVGDQRINSSQARSTTAGHAPETVDAASNRQDRQSAEGTGATHFEEKPSKQRSVEKRRTEVLSRWVSQCLISIVLKVTKKLWATAQNVVLFCFVVDMEIVTKKTSTFEFSASFPT